MRILCILSELIGIYRKGVSNLTGSDWERKFRLWNEFEKEIDSWF